MARKSYDIYGKLIWGGLGQMGRPGLAPGATPLFSPFKPYQPPPVPTGSYDPALDATLGQATRGLGDLQADTETANTRDTVDYGTQQDAINRGYNRTAGDLKTALSRDTLAHDTAVANLTRQYGFLGRSQNEAARHQGVLSGGLLMLSAAKRAANETHDRQPIDTTFSQQKQDISTARTRAGEDRDLNLGALALDLAPPSADNPLGGRRFQDRTTALTRAQRENVFFGGDVNAEKLYQATGAGYVPPPGPKNEGVTGPGTPYREQRVGPWIYRYDQHGKILSRRRA